MKYTVKYDDSKKLDLIGRTVRVFIGVDTELTSGAITMGLTEVPGNTVMDPHVHKDKEELIFVIEGEGESIVGGVREKVGPMTAVKFPVNVEHQMMSTSDKPLKFVFMFNPPHDFAGAK